jgi:roadblock/LC7 domain-containing protein
MAKDNKIDLDILKRLVGELESTLATAEGIKSDKGDLKDYIVEISKCAGLASFISAEANALVGDMQQAVWATQSPKSKEDALSKLIAGLKGGGLPGTN